MLDGLLKSKFYTKCKSDIKVTRTRIEMIKRKRKAMQKYLRNDVADLLRNGLDINAYGRAEGLLVEEIRTSCYEFIELYCQHISNHLSAMNKQSECPEDCREAVSSLMFAAARFADLPELRDLRSLFSEKYGSSLDCYVNKEFVEKLRSDLPSKDMKLQLLQEIAAESGLEWNSKALENKLYKDEPACKEDFTKETNNSVYPLRDNGFKNTPLSIPPEKKKSYSYYEQKEAIEIEEKRPEDVPPVKDIEVDTFKRTKKHNEPAFVRNIPKEEENEEKPASKYSLIPPPYTKSEVNKTKTSLRDNEKVDPTESADRPDTDNNHDQDDQPSKAKTIPKSVRRRNLKPQPKPDVVSEGDDRETTNKEKAAQGQRILKFFDRGGGGDQRDEEETMMDKLLHYYSRKKGPRERGKSVTEQTNEPITPSGSKKHKEVPTRAASLPPELTSPRETTPKKHNRAASFQPEMLNPNVHPKLPDYDDFVARLAAYKRK
ncbi:hypothetical protein BUALT_Bualt07G0141300 [Buddleja alternifolia]|uniref:IST1-like protein n=1 Tax=Buddleja alternifolia TaxID=168488 RepID=A0AAV6XAN1_9LAMI|nr:hypothetical protein BUALT_Bualt07G0141300 [Buddleja alternifolia]